MEAIRNAVRRPVRGVAKILNNLSGGHLSPNAVTIFGLLMHIPIAILIARGYFIYAGLFLIFFGLFDTLDGELARLQGSSSNFGMLLDSVTDRMKEAILYIGIAWFFVWSEHAGFAVWAVAACGASLLVSYVNAWGEVATKDLHLSGHKTNKGFRSGLMSFDVRMVVIILGLLLNHLGLATIIITILAWQTALARLSNISQRLKS